MGTVAEAEKIEGEVNEKRAAQQPETTFGNQSSSKPPVSRTRLHALGFCHRIKTAWTKALDCSIHIDGGGKGKSEETKGESL